jgi:hypothetical protein
MKASDEMAWSIDWAKFGRGLTRSAHFFLYLVAVVLYAVHLIVTDMPKQWNELFAVLAVVLGTLGYGLGAAWSPPRRPWSNEERAAAGLPPLPPSSSSSGPSSPPTPPPPVQPG